MVVDVTGMNDSSYESLEELFVDKETKALLSKWKTSNESGKTKEFETSMITDEEYMKLKEVFKVLHSETEDYSKYRKAFNALCKAAHIVPDGTIIIKYELSKGKDDDRNNLYVKYAENTRPITLPEGTKLYHQSVVGGIKELIPKWKLRGKSEAGYLCDKPRVYLTMSKSLPRISTDNKLKDRLYSYEVVNTPAKVFVDPLLPDIFQKAVYVETETPIPVKPLKSDTILGKIKEKITGDKEEKEEDKKVSEMVVDVTNKEPVNEVTGAAVAKGIGKGITIAIGAACKTIVLYVVAVVILCFILIGVSGIHNKKIDDFISKNPKIKSSIEKIVKKVQDLLNKSIKDDVFSTSGYNGFNRGGLKKRSTENNEYYGPVGEFRICDIYPDDKSFDTDDISDPDYGYSFDLNSPEARKFAQKIKDRYNAFKDAVDQINKQFNDIPNGNLVNLEITTFDDEPAICEENGSFTAHDIVYVNLVIKFKSIDALEQTSDVVSTKEKLQKQFGKINESTNIDEISNVICESLNIEPMNELFGFGKKKEEKKRSTPARKYDLLTEEEFNKCMSIIKKHVNKYSILKDIVSYSGGGIYSTYSEYKNFNSDGVCVAILEWGNDNVPESKMDEYEKQYDSAMKGIESDFAKLPFKVECSNVSDSEWDIICIDVRKPMEKKEDKVNESVESVNEVFGLSKEEKEKKAADRKALSDLEFSYDKKYNAFCLSVSGYSIEKLQNMLDKKASELEDAKAEKKSAEDRQKKLEAQIKIDYLENVCNRCKAMIKKKKSYHNK